MRNKKWETVLAELDKCDMLCANCHREEHQNLMASKQAIEWREEINKHKVREKICPTCNLKFKPHQNSIRFCSKRCAGLSQPTKIDWPNNLPILVKKSSQRAIAKTLGVSDKAVEKRLKNHH